MKLCNVCGERKRLPYGYKCSVCHCEYQKNWYKANPQSASKSAKLRKKTVRQILIDIKSSTSCSDCGKMFPWYVMDFDHVRGEKKFNLSIAAQKLWSLKTVLAEVAKCDVVCSNCHRIRTFTRLADGATGSTADSESVNLGSNPSQPTSL